MPRTQHLTSVLRTVPATFLFMSILINTDYIIVTLLLAISWEPGGIQIMGGFQKLRAGNF